MNKQPNKEEIKNKNHNNGKKRIILALFIFLFIVIVAVWYIASHLILGDQQLLDSKDQQLRDFNSKELDYGQDGLPYLSERQFYIQNGKEDEPIDRGPPNGLVHAAGQIEIQQSDSSTFLKNQSATVTWLKPCAPLKYFVSDLFYCVIGSPTVKFEKRVTRLELLHSVFIKVSSLPLDERINQIQHWISNRNNVSSLPFDYSDIPVFPARQIDNPIKNKLDAALTKAVNLDGKVYAIADKCVNQLNSFFKERGYLEGMNFISKGGVTAWLIARDLVSQNPSSFPDFKATLNQLDQAFGPGDNDTTCLIQKEGKSKEEFKKYSDNVCHEIWEVLKRLQIDPNILDPIKEVAGRILEIEVDETKYQVRLASTSMNIVREGKGPISSSKPQRDTPLYISDNILIESESKTGERISFRLIRLKLFFELLSPVWENEKIIKHLAAEVLDISIPQYDDHELESSIALTADKFLLPSPAYPSSGVPLFSSPSSSLSTSAL